MECIFCKIARKETPADIVAEGENWLAFRDINPQAPTHILVIPKQHWQSVQDAPNLQQLGEILSASTQVARQEGLHERGYRLVINSGAEAGQTIFHLHVHVLGGRPLHWPPG
ncbi:MAG: histidine triad nucleotide-binding protein [Candidatus Caldarchaeum sp.]